MNIKAILFFIIIILGLLLGNGEDSKGQKRKWYVIIIITLLILESCLRNISVGPDTESYYYSFLDIGRQSWQSIFSSFRAAYVEGEGKDVGYLVLMKTVQLLSYNFNMFLFVCALIFFVPLGILLYRYSSHMLQLVFAFSLYVALFHIVALSGIRQQVATGFSFMAFLQLGKNHNWKAILLIVLGAFVHISVSLFLLVPFIKIVCPNWVKTIHLFSFATIPFALVFAGPIMIFLASFLVNDYYTVYGESESDGGAYTYIVLMELLSLFCYIAIKKKNIQENSDLGLWYIMLPLATMTAPLISLNGAMIRVGQYFTLYMMLLVPMAIDFMFKSINNRRVVYYGFIAILLVMSFRSVVFRYYFFWQ